jgi:hypothetical protein
MHELCILKKKIAAGAARSNAAAARDMQPGGNIFNS